MLLDDALSLHGIRNKIELTDETYELPKNDEILFKQSGEDDG